MQCWRNPTRARVQQNIVVSAEVRGGRCAFFARGCKQIAGPGPRYRVALSRIPYRSALQNTTRRYATRAMPAMRRADGSVQEGPFCFEVRVTIESTCRELRGFYRGRASLRRTAKHAVTRGPAASYLSPLQLCLAPNSAPVPSRGRHETLLLLALGSHAGARYRQPRFALSAVQIRYDAILANSARPKVCSAMLQRFRQNNASRLRCALTYPVKSESHGI